MGEVRFMISEAAKQVSVESHVLRYWEEELELSIGRTEMGHRYYTDDDIQLFRCIKKLKDEGMLLKDLKPLIPGLKETRERLKETAKEAAQETAKETKKEIKKETAGETPSAEPDMSAQGEVVIPLRQLDQVRALISEAVNDALSGNREQFKKELSSAVSSEVVHEMDGLLQAKERQQEEHFRRLDTLIRQQQTSRRDTARGNPIMKLRNIFT